MAGPVQYPWQVGSNGATPLTRNEAQTFARSLLNSQDYRDALKRRLLSGNLPPAVETMLWHYAYGKPAETVFMAAVDLSKSSNQELLDLARLTLEELEEAAQTEEAITAEYKVHKTVQ